MPTDEEIFESSVYKAYHQKVVDAICLINGEENRPFWDDCTYIDEFRESLQPDDVANEQISQLESE